MSEVPTPPSRPKHRLRLINPLYVFAVGCAIVILIKLLWLGD